jgi:cell wall-associated protease
LTKADQQAVDRLYKLSREASPTVIAEEIDGYANKMDISKLSGSSLSEPFQSMGMSIQ